MSEDSKLPPVRIFYSYSRKDEPLRDELSAHLAAMRRSELIDDWHDRRILPGDEWNTDIEEHLESSHLILLLISSDFLASDSCQKEMKRALARKAETKAEVIPIIVRPVDWNVDDLRDREALPTDAVSVTDRSWADHDAAWLTVAQGIRAAVERIRKNLQATHQAQAVAPTLEESERLTGVRAELAVQTWLAKSYPEHDVKRIHRPAPVDLVLRDTHGAVTVVEVKTANAFSGTKLRGLVAQIEAFRSESGHTSSKIVWVAETESRAKALLVQLEGETIPADVAVLVGFLDRFGDLQMVHPVDKQAFE